MYKSKYVVPGKLSFDFSQEITRACMPNLDNFVYGHYKVDGGNATICGARLGDHLYYGISLCSPKDNFSRRSGRILSVTHLKESRFSHQRGVMHLSEELSDSVPAVVLREALERHIRKMRKKPSWVNNGVVEFRKIKI